MLSEETCQQCGACCATFRVSFYWSEADPQMGGRVPIELTDAMPPYWRVMKGTAVIPQRCAALEGEIGHHVFCTIYQNRPSPCREFGSTDECAGQPGDDLKRCNQARARFGLPPTG